MMSDAPPTVSIIMNCRNCVAFVREAIDSVYQQTWTDWDIVFYDNASDDGSGDIARQFDARLRYYRAETAVPLGAARNAAVERARGRLIAFLDCDDVWRPEKLEHQIRVFEAQPRVGVVYSALSTLLPTGELRPHDARDLACRGSVLNELFLQNFLGCSSLVVRRTLLDRVGPFDPELNLSEEYDLCLRLAAVTEFDYVEAAVTLYRVHAQNSSWNFPRMQRETILVVERAATRTPALIAAWGGRVWRLRRAGLSCTPGEAFLLGGRLRAARAWFLTRGGVGAAAPRVVLLFGLSLLPARVLAALNRSRMALRHGVFKRLL